MLKNTFYVFDNTLCVCLELTVQNNYPPGSELFASERRENGYWLNELTMAAVLEFDDEVLGAPAYPGLLYLASADHGCLQKVLFRWKVDPSTPTPTFGGNPAQNYHSSG